MSFAGDTVQPGPVPAETWLSFLICEVWIIIELLSESPREEAGKSRVKCLTGGCYCYRCHRTYLGLPWVSRETSGTFRTSVGLENVLCSSSCPVAPTCRQVELSCHSLTHLCPAHGLRAPISCSLSRCSPVGFDQETFVVVMFALMDTEVHHCVLHNDGDTVGEMCC